MSVASEPVGTLEVALAHATRLLATNPSAAVEQATEILKVVPDHPVAVLLLASAERATGNPTAAVERLEKLVRSQPGWAAAHYELGVALGSAGQSEAAISALRRAVNLKPDLAHGWLALGDQLTSAGDAAAADIAYAWHIRASTRDPRLLQAAGALCGNQIPLAEALLRAHLKQFPTDVAAIRMFAEVAARLRRLQDAETLLVRCLELAPSFAGARLNYAAVLHRQNKPVAALREVEILLALEPGNPGYNNLKAAILARMGEYQQTIEIYAAVLAAFPQQPKIWMSYGHALKTKGREEESIAAYDRSIELSPSLGEAYWSLANLKTFRFTQPQVDEMQLQLQRSDLSEEDRLHLHFAVGKALEDTGGYAASFEHYAHGNRMRRSMLRYDPDVVSAHVRRSKALLTRAFFEARSGFGATEPDPIFIVGLPRAGSTLIEQILSSHSQVEGTMELPNIPAIAKALSARARRSELPSYLDLLPSLNTLDWRALGEEYLRETLIQRKTRAPFFIDKLPNNFEHLGLIHLTLPNAKIIDARRHPLGCCFSAFKQHFARGQSFTYGFEDLGRYYRDYIELMAHFDAVLPGRIHRVFYESMIEDTEGEVRRLLAYCGLPFEEACLRFYENERAVRTASSQQVRQPIYRQGVDQWRHFEPWLAPLKEALGDVLERYPATPEF
jgi:tetratricopeptide (TPR) repeat protein